MRSFPAKHPFGTLVLMVAVALCVSSCSRAQTSRASAPVVHQFESPDHIVSLQYSSPMTLCQQGSSPACPADILNLCSGEDDTFEGIACFVYDGKAYEGYNFRSAAMTLGRLRSAPTEKACLALPGTKGRPENINGIAFATSRDGEGAMGTLVDHTYYHAFRGGQCYAAVLSIAISNYGAMDPGTVKEFKAADSDKVLGQLKQVLSTLRIAPGERGKPPAEDRD